MWKHQKPQAANKDHICGEILENISYIKAEEQMRIKSGLVGGTLMVCCMKWYDLSVDNKESGRFEFQNSAAQWRHPLIKTKAQKCSTELNLKLT